jgi:hypothetical protein
MAFSFSQAVTICRLLGLAPKDAYGFVSLPKLAEASYESWREVNGNVPSLHPIVQDMFMARAIAEMQQTIPYKPVAPAPPDEPPTTDPWDKDLAIWQIND